jgi:hypothetical protein
VKANKGQMTRKSYTENYGPISVSCELQFRLALHAFSTMVFVGEVESVLNGTGLRNVVESRTTKKNPLTIWRTTAACHYVR